MRGILIFFGIMAVLQLVRFISPGLYMIVNMLLPIVLIVLMFRRFSRLRDAFQNPSGQFGQDQNPYGSRNKQETQETKDNNTKKREDVNKANPNKEEIVAEVLEVKDLDQED